MNHPKPVAVRERVPGIGSVGATEGEAPLCHALR